jgi:hypothetical protein
MGRILATCLVGLVTVLIGGHAAARDTGGIFDIFQNIMRAAVVDHAKNAWSRIPQNELSCIDQALQQQGQSVDFLIQNGTRPSDPALSSIRSGCRSSNASLTPSNESATEVQDLSAKPTFDCTKAISPTGRIVCLDQAGAKADWDLISASWARNFSLAEADRDGFDQAQQRWLDAGVAAVPRKV